MIPTRGNALCGSLVAGALSVLVASCGFESEPAGEQQATRGRLEVVATTMQLQDFTRRVGGGRVRVTGILDPNSEPHEYEPTASDADAVSRAKLVVQNGAGLDEWLGDLLQNAGADARRVDASRGVELLPTEEKGFPGDPHVWHDPALAKRMVDNVAAGLAEADPRGRATYERNAAAYKREIDRMEKDILVEFAPIPPARRNLVTSHDAFGYFARAYDIEVVGSVLPTVTTASEPSARRVRELMDEIRTRRVRTIFTEEAVDATLERQIAREAGATVSTSLYADVLGGPGSGAETFIDAELANARALKASWQAP